MFQITSPDVAIDLGTKNTRIYVKGKGIVINEPTIVVVENTPEQRVIGIGDSAQTLLGRSAGNYREISPVRDGIVIEYEQTQVILRYLLRKALGKAPVFGPRIVVTHPGGISKVELRAVTGALSKIGGKNIYTVEKAFAAAIGTGLPVYEPHGCFVVDIGAGTTEVALVSMGGIVLSHSITVAGNKIDEAISGYLKKQHSILVTDRIAEQIKLDIGSVYGDSEQGIAVVRGRDIATGMPMTVDVSKSQIVLAIREVLSPILDAVKWVLGRIPPELAADVLRNGIYLTGGSAALPGLDQLIAEEFGIPVSVARDAAECAIIGAGYMTDHFDMLDGTAAANGK